MAVHGEEQHWLIVERIENWDADYANSFAFFGLPPRYAKASTQIKKGDKVYCYVSRVSAFSDIRIVREPGIKKMKSGSFEDIYNRDFAYYFLTSPVLVLKRESWIPLSQLVSILELTKDRTHWSQRAKTGLGTGIVNALAKQLNAKVETVSGPRGTSVSVTHATFAAKKTRAA